jgi:hypothetical protein
MLQARAGRSRVVVYLQPAALLSVFLVMLAVGMSVSERE